jgi:putative nucleotidyltransferase with HDIG domain
MSMDEKNLEHIRRWFSDYCQSFYSEDVVDQRNILLKDRHTHLVCANIIRIAATESLERERLLLAETIALLHDVGRFEQYRQFRTFRDSISVNHAALGAKIIREIDLLADLSPRERDLVHDAVESHNIFTIPKKITGEHRFFLQLVRDADKLDIWRVFTEFYQQAEAERSSAAGLGFPDRPECSAEIVDKVANGEIVLLSSARTLNDFKLIQLSWVYDLTFAESFRMVAERDAVHGIAGTLPDCEGVRRAVEAVRRFVEERGKAPVRNGEGT